jgi:hypothetical protein
VKDIHKVTTDTLFKHIPAVEVVGLCMTDRHSNPGSIVRCVLTIPSSFRVF